MTGLVLDTPGATRSLEDLVKSFKPGTPINVAAQLKATTFEKSPDTMERVLYSPHIPMHFSWNITPKEESTQSLSIDLFLEGIPLGGDEVYLVPIYSATITIVVDVDMFSWGKPIAVYGIIYALLTVACGALVTGGFPILRDWITSWKKSTERHAEEERVPNRLKIATLSDKFYRKRRGRFGK